MRESRFPQSIMDYVLYFRNKILFIFKLGCEVENEGYNT